MPTKTKKPPTAIKRLRAGVAGAWRPRPRVSPAEWIGANLRLSSLEAAKGPYDLAGRPWWVGILEAIASPLVRTIVVTASTQVGKTLALCAVICYLARNAPASALVVLPTKDDAQEFRERLYALAAESGLTIPPEGKWNLRFCQIESMRVYLAWSGSRQRLRGRRCKYVFLTELDVYAKYGKGGDPVEAARQRVKGFSRHLIFAECSPVAGVSRVTELERQPERRRLRYHCRCPHCGLYQDLRFFPFGEGDAAGRCGVAGLHDAAGQRLDPDQARQSAYYVCRNGCRIDDGDKQQLVTTGVWVPEGCDAAADGAVTGTPARGERDLAFRLWAANSPKGWGEIGAEYLVAERDGTVPDFFQNWLGISYRVKSTLPTWEELGLRLAVPYYVRGQVPEWAWFLTAGCDCQQDEVYCVVRAWGDKRTSALVDWFVFERREDDETELIKSDLAQLDEVLSRQFPVVGTNPRGKTELGVALLGVDANYRTLDVHEWIRAHGKPAKIRAVRGDGKLAAETKYKPSTVKESRRERENGTGPVVYEGGLDLWSIAVESFHLDLVDRFSGDPGKPGAWLLPGNVVTTGRHYLRQLVNEMPYYTRGKDGRPKLEWRERDHNLGHDFGDCEVYASALAQMFVDQLRGSPGWDASRWDREQAAEKPTAGATERAARPEGGIRGLDRSAR